MIRCLALSVLLLAACGPARHLPDLPDVDLSRTDVAVREAINPALTAARANPSDAAAVARLGMLLHANGQPAPAARAYERAAALDPVNLEFSYYRGVALAAAGDPASALAPLRVALNLPAARLRLAEAHHAAGQIPEARKEFEAVLAVDANNARAHYGLGRCLQGAEAVASFERALKLFPRYGAARFALAGALRQQNRAADADAALKDYDRDKFIAPPIHDPAMAAVEALDANGPAKVRAAQAFDTQGQLPQAIAELENVLAATPRLTPAWVHLISLYARTNQPDKADSAYRQAISLEPRNAEAHYNYGVLCEKSKRLGEAVLAFEAAVETGGKSPRAADYFNALGTAQVRAGDRANGAKALERARELGKAR